MPNRLTRPGAFAYVATGLLLAYEIVRLLGLDGFWERRVWAGGVVGIVGVCVVLFAVAAVSRTPLVGDGDRLLTRFGGLAVIGLTAVALLVVAVGDLEDFVLWPTSPAVFVPFWVRRLEEAYFEGVEEARRETAAARGDQQ